MTADAWQPISTAPRDGTQILLWLDPPIDTNDMHVWVSEYEMRIVVGWWDGFAWQCGFTEDATADTEGHFGQIGMVVQPTKWQPLPAPPADDKV